MNLAAIVVPFVAVILLLFILSRLVVSEAGSNRQPEELSGGALQFLPNPSAYWGVYLFLGCLAFLALSGTVNAIRGGSGLIPAILCAGFFVFLLSAYPGSIVANKDGLEQLYWLTGRKSIPWNEVWSVAVDLKSGRVTVTGKRSVKIVHTRQLPGRDRFLAELETHCPDRMPGAHRVVSAPVDLSR